MSAEATDIAYKPRRRWHEDPRPLTYVVIEVKTDGGDPRRNAIRAVAAEALNERGEPIGSFHMNLAPPEGAVADPKMLARYRDHPEAWTAMTQGAQQASTAMAHFAGWVRGLPGQPAAVGAPLAHVARWLDVYLRRHTAYVFQRGPASGDALFAGSGIDLHSFAMGAAGLHYRRAVEHLLPADWREGRVETHHPREDALMHAALLRTLLRLQARRAPVV